MFFISFIINNNSLQKKDIFWDVGSNHGEIVKKAKSFLGNDIYCIAFKSVAMLNIIIFLFNSKT